MKPAFQFDSRFCTGCKTCQAACKDKNTLPEGILWRRVYEVSGGSWKKQGITWTNDIFAYNISMGCNHCEHPICAGVCPTNAYSINYEGVVLLDQSKCLGCGYCSWACPYGAPQMDLTRGVMTKCDFCIDDLENGLKPACVNSCPMRCIEMIDLEKQSPDEFLVQSIPPMVGPEARKPKIHIFPHKAVNQALTSGADIINKEEVQPRWHGRFEEFPLVAFSILAQTAIGAFWGFLAFWYFNLWRLGAIDHQKLQTLLSICLILIGVGLAISFKHLKNPINAWRVLSHLNKSWLSREILFSGLFALLNLVLLTLSFININASIINFLLPITGFIGISTLLSMARVYQLNTVPLWNTINTPISFLISTIVLGSFVVITIETYRSQVSFYTVQFNGWMIGISSLALAYLLIEKVFFSRKNKENIPRIVLSVLGILIILINIYKLIYLPDWIIIVLLVIYMAEEILGRLSFYWKRIQQF